MIKTYHRERLIKAIVYFAINTKYCGKTKLMKLLFYFDFYHFKQTGKTVTGLEYHAWQRGPVPTLLYEELSNMKPDMAKEIVIVPIEKFQKIQAKKKFSEDCFTPRQLKLLEQIAFIFDEAKAADMTEISHLPNQPWHKTLTQKGEFAKIDYLLAIDGSKDCLCEDEAREIMYEVSEMHEIFGTV
jgi:uncharacterized phage-associated protein